jgi:tetratricopeptide (TPR) repeat protein
MLSAALLSFVIAVLVVSVPRLLYRVVLGVTWQMPSFRWWAAQSLVAIFAVEFVVSGLYGLAFARKLGALLFLGTFVYFGTGTWRAWRLQGALKGLFEPGRRDASLAKMMVELERRRGKATRSPGRYESYARTALFAGTTLDAVGLTSIAIGVIEKIEESRLSPSTRAMRAQNLGAFRIRSGDREGARTELARVPRPVPDPLYEEAIASLEVLLLALEGNPEEAELRARSALERSKSPPVLATWQSALAHALAAQGSRDEAMAILRQMHAAALGRVVRQHGAASTLAESLEAETDTPYR